MFRVRRAEESESKTFRFPKSLLEKMAEISQNEGVSLNSFVVQCCEYAIAHFEKPDEESDKRD